MKFVLKTSLVICSGMLVAIAGPVSAQSFPSSMPPLASHSAVSITAHLQLSNGQIERLDRLYEAYVSRRVTLDANLRRWQGELQIAQAPTSFDERRASRLLRDINKAQQSLAADLLKTRGKALAVLTSVQRAQLQSFVSDTRLSWREDSYSLLLATPIDDVVGAPLEEGTLGAKQIEPLASNRRRQAKGGGNYNVYAGYGYGQPQYGVYGNYGQGPVGVYGQVGRGGPSVGVSVGGVFGGWLRSR